MKILKNACGIFFLLIIASSIAVAQTPGKEVKLTPSEKKQLNTFFSNFSEVFVEPFVKDKISDIKLIEFSIYHNYKNNEKRFVKGGKEYQVKIKASYIEESVMKYFGKKIAKHQSVEDRGIEYRDGWYYTTDATGEEYDFSQVVSLTDNGGNMFTAVVNVYSAGSGWVGDVHASEKEWRKADPDDVPQATGKMKATLQKVTEKGKSRYILIDYIKMEETDFSGIYKLSDGPVCDIVITVKKENSGYSYEISGTGMQSTGLISVVKDGEDSYLAFNGTHRGGDNAAIEGLYSEGKITVQNYGNSLNQYVCFKKCDRKFLVFVKEE
ncbi:MAG TPA: hypothetical protein PLY21_08230 [Spirochaetota bacterium]|nr:hypothetical protein [Spirochaetota bacterium]